MPSSVSFGYETLRSPLGDVSVIEGPKGLVAIELCARPSARLRKRLAHAFGGEVELAPRRGRAGRQLAEYFAGRRRRFALPLDLRLATPFQRKVLRALREVPYGEIVSYGELAERAGRPGAARAVGVAMRNNPLPIVLPCHRVAAADGSLGGFSAGLDNKRRLHALEGMKARPGGWAPKRRVD